MNESTYFTPLNKRQLAILKIMKIVSILLLGALSFWAADWWSWKLSISLPMAAVIYALIYTTSVSLVRQRAEEGKINFVYNPEGR